jgi:sulfur carrier protein ThiS
MARIVLAPALARWLPPDAKAESGGLAGEVALETDAATVGEALAAAFALHPRLRGYVLDEQGVVRHHVAVFVDGAALRDKRDLSQPVAAGTEIHVMQALSGG